MIGPDGGNVRSLAYDPSDPSHLLLGTSAAQLFVSHDGGNSWAPFAHLGRSDDLVIDHVVFDPTNTKIIYAAGWGLYHDDEGDVFRSDDGGVTWHALDGTHGKSIRALAMAPSDHNTLVIGALDGVFWSRDAGATWQRMTPENPDVTDHYSTMRNFVSVAIDPQNPETVYAGTRHLAWKTANGGQSWHSIHDGMLDDSDVFSIIVDPKNPSHVYASACSGIYRSDNGADLFHRVQGMPHSAIRTRILKQDPVRPSIVYAGTTGGLWRTMDGGGEVVSGHLGRRGGQRCADRSAQPGARSVGNRPRRSVGHERRVRKIQPSNSGFSHRMVGAVITDRDDPNRLYVGIVNDKVHGGMFTTNDVGKSWEQVSRGLGDREYPEPATGCERRNLCRYQPWHLLPYLDGKRMAAGGDDSRAVPEWQKKETPPEPVKPVASKSKTGHPTAKKTTTAKKEPVEVPIPVAIAPRVRSLQITQKAWYAATNEGLFISVDGGKKWYGTPVEGESDFIVANEYTDGTLTLASVKRAFLSHDGGRSMDGGYASEVRDRHLRLHHDSRFDAVAGDERRGGALSRWRSDLGACHEWAATESCVGRDL